MPKEHQSRREVINAIKSVPYMAPLLSMHEGHFDYELDLEVIVYGRNYSGKKVGPYVRLLSYDPDEVIVREGDWGGNTYYIVVNGRAEVLALADGRQIKVSELPEGMQFGEMSILAGVPRAATVKAPADRSIQVLEIQRPALRLLRKLPTVSELVDRTYRTYGKKNTLEELQERLRFDPETTKSLQAVSRFRVFGKNHLLARQNSEIDHFYFIRDGWLRRSYDTTANGVPIQDFLGKGFCFGLEAASARALWPYSIHLMARTEVLQFSLKELARSPQLRETAVGLLSQLAPPQLAGQVPDLEKYNAMLHSQQRLIDTGMVDGTNLLVMDMDLCVRCGNCSLACHKVHGRSRLLREGIHLERMKLPTKKHQSILYPEVCMHCEDPECLTGCPTGAIGRMPQGYIDINPKTCIGCGDCAVQCPYNAISMIPRKEAPAAAAASFPDKLRDLFRIRLDPLPPAVKQLDDLLAVKCNLCAGTGLNPPGKKPTTYSCEMSCPTGALVRINPSVYFQEVGSIQNLTALDRTHATGRNIHVSDPPKRLLHAAGIATTLVITLLTVLGLMYYGLGEKLISFLNMRWITGIVGLVAIVIAMAYPFRRQIYRKRATPLRYWMLVHAYAGVVAAIVIVLHGGVDSGGLLTSLLMWSYDLVILTGLFGIATYYFVPRLLTQIEGTPLLQDSLSARKKELQEEIAKIQGATTDRVRDAFAKKVVPYFISFRYVLRQYIKKQDLDTMLAEAQKQFESVSQGWTEREARYFNRAVEHAAMLRRVEALIFLHRLLKAWLPPHVITTSLMLALMFIHIGQVIYFSWR